MSTIGYSRVFDCFMGCAYNIVFGILFHNFSNDKEYYSSDDCVYLRNWTDSYSQALFGSLILFYNFVYSLLCDLCLMFVSLRTDNSKISKNHGN